MFKNDDLIKMIKGRKGEKNVSLYLYEVSKIEKHFSALFSVAGDYLSNCNFNKINQNPLENGNIGIVGH